MKVPFLVFLVSMTCVANCQNPEVLKPYFSSIIVSDMNQSLDWYTKLGFEIVSRNEIKERGLKISNLKSEFGHIELIELRASASPKDLLEGFPDISRMQGFFKIGYVTTQFDDWIEYLQDQSMAVKEDVVEDPVSGNRMIVFKDPDGNRIQIFEEM